VRTPILRRKSAPLIWPQVDKRSLRALRSWAIKSGIFFRGEMPKNVDRADLFKSNYVASVVKKSAPKMDDF
jgi:hypothetical protein